MNNLWKPDLPFYKYTCETRIAFSTIFLLIFITLGCNDHPDGDSTWFSGTRVLTLQENDEVLLSDIHRVDLSPDGTILAIGDRRRRTTVLYNAHTGDIINELDLISSSTDTIAIKTKNYPFPQDSGGKLLTIQEFEALRRRSITQDELRRMLPTNFFTPLFHGASTIYFIGDVQGLYVRQDSLRGESIGTFPNPTVLITDSDGKMRSVLPYDLSIGPPYPRNYLFITKGGDVDSFAVATIDSRMAKDGAYRTAASVSIFTNNWKTVRHVLPLPPEFRHPKLSYNYLRVCGDWSKEDTIGLIIGFSLLPKVYQARFDRWIVLDSLDVNSGFFAAIRSGKADSGGDQLLRFRLEDLTIGNDNCLYVTGQTYANGQPEWFARKYSLTGELLKNDYLRRSSVSHQLIEHVQFVHDAKILFVASISDDTWRVEMIEI